MLALKRPQARGLPRGRGWLPGQAVIYDLNLPILSNQNKVLLLARSGPPNTRRGLSERSEGAPPRRPPPNTQLLPGR